MSETAIPPRCDLEAEAAVLSACLLSEDAALEVIDLLDAGDFYADANRRVFESVVDILRASGRVDVLSVASLLRANGRMEQIGGSTYLAQLADATPAVAHVAHHAKIVRDLARIRRAEQVFTALATSARMEAITDVDAWLENCEATAYAATANRGDGKPTAFTYRDLARMAYREIAEANRKGATMLGRSTGFASLDAHLGGMEGGDLIVLAGRPGHGKTALALQVLENVAAGGASANPAAGVMLSQEMLGVRLLLRSVARHGGEPLRLLRQGKPSNWNTVQAATNKLADLPAMIDDEKRLTPLKVRAKIRRHLNTIRTRFPEIPLGLVVIDYIQLMQADGQIRGENRSLELGRITRELKMTAGEFNVPILLLSQLRRADKRSGKGGNAPKPTLEDLRDSGSIEADADVVIAVHREDEHRPPDEKPDGLADLLVLKGRNSGRANHQLKFDGSRTEFFEPNVSQLGIEFENGDQYDG